MGLDLAIVAACLLVNALLAGSEIAFVSLRDTQVSRLEQRGERGRVLGRLARDPTRFLTTIQLGINLVGFLASASVALNTSALYIGQALGAAAGGLMIATSGFDSLSWAGLVGVLAAMGMSAWASRLAAKPREA